jgi:hypothetical protein
MQMPYNGLYINNDQNNFMMQKHRMVTTCNTIIFVITKTFCILQEYYKKLKALDRIATFLNGPQRKKKNDEPYVATVKHILYG